MSFSWLPALYQEIAEVAGLDIAIKLGEAYGGTELYLPAPARCTPEHPLAKLLGLEAALKICQWRGREHIMLPLAVDSGLAGRRRRAKAALARGASANEAARIAGSTARTMHRYRAEERETIGGRQPDLFSDKKLS